MTIRGGYISVIAMSALTFNELDMGGEVVWVITIRNRQYHLELNAVIHIESGRVL